MHKGQDLLIEHGLLAWTASASGGALGLRDLLEGRDLVTRHGPHDRDGPAGWA